MNQTGNQLHCAICNQAIETDGVILSSKGIDGVNNASKARGDSIIVVQGNSVHKKCRQQYTHPTNIAKSLRQCEGPSHAQRILRLRGNWQFDFKKDCLFCGTEIDKEQERRRARVVCAVRTMDMQETILSACEAREDEWAEVVRTRIQSVHDLPAADAIYHHSCSTNFRTKMNIPPPFHSDQPKSKKRKAGRPVDQNVNDAFLSVVQYLEENDDEQVTVSDLTGKMQQYLGEAAFGSTYTTRYMKERILEHFGENVVITNKPGKTNIVTFRRTAASILDEFHSQQKENKNPEEEKFDVIRAAAKLLRSDLKLIVTPDDNYPLIGNDMDKHVNFLPPTLELLLEEMFSEKKSDIKVASIGQAIMQQQQQQQQQHTLFTLYINS